MLKKKVDLKMVLGLYFFNPATKQSVTQGGEKIAENYDGFFSIAFGLSCLHLCKRK